MSNKHFPSVTAVAGFTFGFVLMMVNVAHNNDSAKLAMLIVGAVVCVASPAGALAWNLHRKGRLSVRRVEWIAASMMIIGMVGPRRVDALVPYRFGDISGLVFFAGFILLACSLVIRWKATPSEPETCEAQS